MIIHNEKMLFNFIRDLLFSVHDSDNSSEECDINDDDFYIDSPLALQAVKRFDNITFIEIIKRDLAKIKIYAQRYAFDVFISKMDKLLEKRNAIAMKADLEFVTEMAMNELINDHQYDTGILGAMYNVCDYDELSYAKFLWLWSSLLLGRYKKEFYESIQNVKPNHSLLVCLGYGKNELNAYLMIIAYLIYTISKCDRGIITLWKRRRHAVLVYLESSISQAMELLMQAALVPSNIRSDVMAIVRTSDENGARYCLPCRQKLMLSGIAGHSQIMDGVHYKLKPVDTNSPSNEWPYPIPDDIKSNDVIISSINDLALSVMNSISDITEEMGMCQECGSVQPKVRETWMVTATNMILFNEWLEFVPSAKNDLKKFVSVMKSKDHLGVCTMWDLGEMILNNPDVMEIQMKNSEIKQIRSSYNSVVAVGLQKQWLVNPLIACALGENINHLTALVRVCTDELGVDGLYMVKKRGIDWVGRRVTDEGAFNNSQIKSNDTSNNISMGLDIRKNGDIVAMVSEERVDGCLSGRPCFGTKCNHRLVHGCIDSRSIEVTVDEALSIDSIISTEIYSIMCYDNKAAQACVLSIMQGRSMWIYIQHQDECGSCAYNRAFREHCNIIIN
jgi:hypothetical protein